MATVVESGHLIDGRDAREHVGQGFRFALCHPDICRHPSQLGFRFFALELHGFHFDLKFFNLLAALVEIVAQLLVFLGRHRGQPSRVAALPGAHHNGRGGADQGDEGMVRIGIGA